MSNNSAPKCPVKELSEMSISETKGNGTAVPLRFSRISKSSTSSTSNSGLGRGSSSPLRRVQRNKSGPQGRITRVGRAPSSRAPPRRSQSSKIGRPTFNPVLPDAGVSVEQQHGKRRGVNRSHSNKVKGTTRNVPARSGSFQRRRVPDRTSSTSSLRRAANKRQQQSGNVSVTISTAETDDVSVSDSVFTSISIQTMDSIMVRKKQIPPSQEKNGVNSEMAIEFDDSIHGIEHGSYSDDGDVYEYEEDLSVFSESWCSSESCEVLSDYEEGEMDGAILEDAEGEDKDETTTSAPSLTIGGDCTSTE